ncbi:aromatic amino acid permease [Streptomyces sp. 1114.5]|uniref:amino acid permease n=1 Tax=Streptomyces sp. 1114.5 TaxID=1938830 RepID=UPI000EAE00BB|nr:amino acid permease [Streptomyces sp. 1114.5]RKT09287.1 aromatic amino acid permease [Streptomyces sp. 1114.5]
MSEDRSVSRGLRQRHIAMIALGGAIGAGLFVGSGVGIAAAGPGIVVSYVVAGALTVVVMRMLGEMSAAHPDSGSFAAHAARAWGPWAGLLAGWMYWALLVVSVAAEAIGASRIVAGWLPQVPAWVWVAAFMALFTGTNLAGVRRFGELEFWFAGVKAASICAFILLGAAAVLTGRTPAAENLTAHGGLLPHGWHGVAVGTIAAVFAYGGLETVTIAAAECEDPVAAVRRAVRTVLWRVALFYIGSMAVIVAVVPWDDPAVAGGPYAAAIGRIGVPGAAQLMDAVVLVALLSAMNANIYGSSRMLHALAARGDAPRLLTRRGRSAGRGDGAAGTGRAVLASAAFGFVSVVLSLRWPRSVFPFLLNSIGTAILVVWILIAASHLRLHGRRQRPDGPGQQGREQERGSRQAGPVRGLPYLGYAALAAMAGVLVFMLVDPGSRSQVLCTGAWTAVLLLVAGVRRRRRRPDDAPAAAPTDPAEPAADPEAEPAVAALTAAARTVPGTGRPRS